MLLKDFRLKMGLEQTDVASKLQISVRQYQRFEAGHSFPRENNLRKLEDLFQIPQRVLFSKSVHEVPEYLKGFLP